jgi:hypothetical protein
MAQLRAQPAEAAAMATTPPQALATPAPQPATPAPRTASDKLIVVPVPYGAEPLSGARLDAIRQQLYRLARQKVTGVVDIRTYAGRFCLVGSTIEGFSPAPEELPLTRCDLIGNPSEDAQASTQRPPLALANVIAEIHSLTHGTLDPQVSAGDPANVLAPYPPPTAYLIAGEWNRAASANNRVEIRVR